MITTLSGTYTVQQYENITDTLKTTFKRYWQGKCNWKELDTIKAITGLSHAEIETCRYEASLEVEMGV